MRSFRRILYQIAMSICVRLGLVAEPVSTERKGLKFGKYLKPIVRVWMKRDFWSRMMRID